MKGIIILFCVFSVLMVSGCSSDKVMRERFGDKRPVIMTEEVSGGRYVVTHHVGDNYTVEPLTEGEGE